MLPATRTKTNLRCRLKLVRQISLRAASLISPPYIAGTNVGSGIATVFGAIPFNNALPQAGLSETRFSSQYSRLSLKVDTHLTESTSLTGYVETDFLGFQRQTLPDRQQR